MAEVEKLIEIYQQLEDAGLMVVAGKKATAELMVSHDVVPVVRCKDCKHGEFWCKLGNKSAYICRNTLVGLYGWGIAEDDFCSYGERRTDERKAD